jgi:hypothetical protein
MRTTLTLDEDVAVLLREEAERSRRPFKEVVNQAIRLGLRTGSGHAGRRHAARTYPMEFRAGIDQDKLNQLVDELETEEIVRKLRREEEDAARG